MRAYKELNTAPGSRRLSRNVTYLHRTHSNREKQMKRAVADFPIRV